MRDEHTLDRHVPSAHAVRINEHGYFLLPGLTYTERDRSSDGILSVSFSIKESYIYQLGLSGNELIVYSFIAEFSPLSISLTKLSMYCGMSISGCKRVLTKLTQRGLVVIERDYVPHVAPRVIRAVGVNEYQKLRGRSSGEEAML